MPLVTTKEMFEKSMKEKFAIGAFNVNNMEIIQGIVDAAAEQKSPVILQASSSAIKYARINYLMKMVEAAMEEHPEVPVAIHLDHGPDFETAKMCIDNGFTSVMIDGSKYDFEENVALTKKVVDYAHSKGVVVEAELGKLAGIEDEVNVSEKDAMYTDPEQAKEFVERTGCDSLAIAIGTSHGAYKFKGEAKLRFDILAKIKELIPNTPIVLHGASTVIPELVDMCNKYGGNIPGAKGVPDEMLHEASLSGVSKINVDTDLRLAMTSEIRKVFAEEPGVFDPRKYLAPARESIKKTVEHKIRDVFGSSNKI
ncbi:MAG TPA: class II fructose-1,6-bisphosphate aldolase [Clostridiaceae bacterium]|jgi:fructose-bisphosphate aldolase class II|nr:fructose-1 6-bisphosphate aldolase class II [Clostridium sp. CAG:571]HJJ07336.1 class II fructose-1,6-bisphosphate aldolase [Clostridiaceae bacterium]HJJ14765.1 class II fructose-1,6-bisphosphate aldolase [Clostridiaceae bacterium]